MTIPVSSSSMAGPSLTYPGQWHCVGRSTAANRSQLMLPLPAAAVQCGSRTRCPSRADESATASLDDLSGGIVTRGYQATSSQPTARGWPRAARRPPGPGSCQERFARSTVAHPGGRSQSGIRAISSIGQTPPAGVFGDEQVVHDADPRGTGSRPRPVHRGESRSVARRHRARSAAPLRDRDLRPAPLPGQSDPRRWVPRGRSRSTRASTAASRSHPKRRPARSNTRSPRRPPSQCRVLDQSGSLTTRRRVRVAAARARSRCRSR